MLERFQKVRTSLSELPGCHSIYSDVQGCAVRNYPRRHSQWCSELLRACTPTLERRKLLLRCLEFMMRHSQGCSELERAFLRCSIAESEDFADRVTQGGTAKGAASMASIDSEARVESEGFAVIITQGVTTKGVASSGKHLWRCASAESEGSAVRGTAVRGTQGGTAKGQRVWRALIAMRGRVCCNASLCPLHG